MVRVIKDYYDVHCTAFKLELKAKPEAFLILLLLISKTFDTLSLNIVLSSKITVIEAVREKISSGLKSLAQKVRKG